MAVPTHSYLMSCLPFFVFYRLLWFLLLVSFVRLVHSDINVQVSVSFTSHLFSIFFFVFVSHFRLINSNNRRIYFGIYKLNKFSYFFLFCHINLLKLNVNAFKEIRYINYSNKFCCLYLKFKSLRARIKAFIPLITMKNGI